MLINLKPTDNNYAENFIGDQKMTILCEVRHTI